MQKVAWAMTTVRIESCIPKSVLKALFNAIPVTMPGKAIGKIIIRLTAFLPKNLYLDKAIASIVPSTKAIAAEHAAITKLVIKASSNPVDAPARCHHSRVNPGGGQSMFREELKELSNTIANGKYMTVRMDEVIATNVHLADLESLIGYPELQFF